MIVSARNLLTCAEVAELLGCSVQNVRYHVRKGNLDAVTIGGTRFVPRDAIASFQRKITTRGTKRNARQNNKENGKA